MVLGLAVEAADPPSFTVATSSMIAVLGLVAINGFFVAAEFALVAARRSKVDEMVAKGDWGAKTVQTALQHLDRYIAGTQLGITIASLALGWVGEPVLAHLFDQVFRTMGLSPSPSTTHVAALLVAFFLLTFFHIVLGGLVPKSIALASPEKTARAVSRPLIVFSRFLSPFIWIFNGAANALLRVFGVEPASDETEATEQEVWEVLRRERYSRYPVYRESLDDVVGVFLAKDLWLHSGDAPFNLADFVREPMYVPDSRPAERVLDDLRRTRAHMAVVLDEYGGTAGIVTMEDLVEEVVGDIADEYDFASRESIVTDGVLELAGSLSLIDVRSDYRIQIPEGDWTTLGGYAFAKLGRLPRMGDRIPIPGGEMEVVAMDGRRIAALRIHRAGIRQPAAVPQPA